MEVFSAFTHAAILHIENVVKVMEIQELPTYDFLFIITKTNLIMKYIGNHDEGDNHKPLHCDFITIKTGYIHGIFCRLLVMNIAVILLR